MSKVLISLKHTHAGEDFFTLWRANNSGYTYSLHAAGKYENIEPGYHDKADVIPVEWHDAVDCAVHYDEDDCDVIPNDNYTREKLGISIVGNKLVRNGYKD